MKKPKKNPSLAKTVELQLKIVTLERELKETIRNAEHVQRAFALDKAKRTDQMRVLLQVSNLLLWVASREVGVDINLTERIK